MGLTVPMKIIDVHTHAFPDRLAEQAMAGLLKAAGNYRPHTDGTIAGLTASMDAAGITSSFVLNIATNPRQAGNIRRWCSEIGSDRIIPVGSVHPRSPSAAAELAALKDAGVKGVKLHPVYQNFNADDKAVFPVYETISSLGMRLQNRLRQTVGEKPGLISGAVLI